MPIAIPTTVAVANPAAAFTARNVPLTRREHRGPIGDERRRVVEQRFALDEGHDPARHAQPAEDGRRGDRVRGADDRAENQ